MITYRDRTFCTAACGTTSCPARLTDEVKTTARNAGLPLSMADLSVGCVEWTPPKPTEVDQESDS